MTTTINSIKVKPRQSPSLHWPAQQASDGDELLVARFNIFLIPSHWI
ncbi:hypothetical protein J538_0368 [Acinetobacter sp. 272263]|nr:hypothetical protein J538_0368 [Acinetobacter sp. 272263]